MVLIESLHPLALFAIRRWQSGWDQNQIELHKVVDRCQKSWQLMYTYIYREREKMTSIFNLLNFLQYKKQKQSKKKRHSLVRSCPVEMVGTGAAFSVLLINHLLCSIMLSNLGGNYLLVVVGANDFNHHGSDHTSAYEVFCSLLWFLWISFTFLRKGLGCASHLFYKKEVLLCFFVFLFSVCLFN